MNYHLEIDRVWNRRRESITTKIDDFVNKDILGKNYSVYIELKWKSGFLDITCNHEEDFSSQAGRDWSNGSM